MMVSVDGFVQPVMSISIIVPAAAYAVNASAQVMTLCATLLAVEKAAVGVVDVLMVQPTLQVMVYISAVSIVVGMVNLNP